MGKVPLKFGLYLLENSIKIERILSGKRPNVEYFYVCKECKFKHKGSCYGPNRNCPKCKNEGYGYNFTRIEI